MLVRPVSCVPLILVYSDCALVTLCPAVLCLACASAFYQCAPSRAVAPRSAPFAMHACVRRAVSTASSVWALRRVVAPLGAHCAVRAVL